MPAGPLPEPQDSAVGRVAPRRWWPRLFASPAGAPTARRATDGLLLGCGLVGLAVLVGVYPPGPLERQLARLLAVVPDWIGPGGAFLFDLLLAWAIALVVVVAAGRRLAVAGQAVVALVLAAGVSLVCTRIALGGWPGVLDAVWGGAGAPGFPAFRIAEAGAVLLTIGPHLAQGLRQIGRWVLALGVAGGLLVDPSVPSAQVAGLLVAVVAATSVRLAFGTSLGRPGLGDVRDALRELGVAVDGLEAVTRQVSGVYALEAVDDDGLPLVVKVYGRDAYDTQLLATVWRTLWYQDASRRLELSRIRAVEREALVTLLAARAGVPTRDVVVAGATDDGDALLVLRGAAEPLAALPRDDARAAPRAWWDALDRLRAARIAHRDLEPATVALVGGEAGFVDLGQATVTPTADHLLTDRARLLATLAATHGAEPAVASALDALGAEGLGELVPYLQPAALGGPLRRTLKEREIDVDELREAAAVAAGVAEPELARLRRVTWGTAVQLALLVLAAGAMVTIVGNVDLGQLRADLENASWGWIAVALLVAQLPRLTQSLSSLGSIAADVRFTPVYLLQLATAYLNLALPSSLARMAVFVRFFQRQGLPAAAAVTAGALDSFAGNILQALLVLVLVVFSSQDVPLDLTAPSGGMLTLLWILAAAVVASVLAIVLVGRIRRPLVERVRVWWPQARSSLGVLRMPKRLALLIGGNLATELLFAVALGMFARAFGYDLPLTALIVINSGTSMLSAFVPVPGGIGVVEFALEIGLTSAGMSPSAALGAIVLYRMATFYLPPIWGFFALRWLQRNRYL